MVDKKTKMKRVYFFLFTLLILTSVVFLFTYLHKQQTISSLKLGSTKLITYTQWGYKTQEFVKIYNLLLNEANSLSLFIFPFKTQYLQNKQDNILHLVQAGYATEVIDKKEQVKSRLMYLRDRVRNNLSLSEDKKKEYFDQFDVIAGEVFEKNSDINGLEIAIKTLNNQDEKITQEVEMVRKESLFGELKRYKTTCEELLTYFVEENSENNQELARKCITSADTLMGPGYAENGVDFIETLSRERVFSFAQKAIQAKQQLIQEEQYALSMKTKEEERLNLVPPSPIQEGKVIVVNLALQRLFAYEKGIPLFSTSVPITTGKYGFETVTGEFAIYLKEQQHKMQSPFPGIYYDDVVNYWMPFYLGYGLHDAPWRSVYGTQDYTSIGSHGCVNMPLIQTIILYNWAEVGTRVIVL